MKPLDPRLLRASRATRVYLVAAGLLGVVSAVLIIAQAYLLTRGVVEVFQQGAGLAQLRPTLLLLAAVVVGRALVAWLAELAGHRAGASVKSELRARLLTHIAALGPGWAAGQQVGRLALLVGRGVDALDGYYSRYLPTLVQAVVVPPAVLLVVLTQDVLSFVVILVTLPLIPVFAALVGWHTEKQTARQWRTLERLSGHFHDVVTGLPTLKVFGRAAGQTRAIREVSERYRQRTMQVLRVSFLSAFVLELAATLSVALVAVEIGVRLVEGGLDLRTGLFVLLLAPEAYLPLRAVGAQFHASAEGVAAAQRVFEVLETPVPEQGSGNTVPDPATAPVRLSGVSVTYPGTDSPALPPTDLVVAPGEVVALTGASGAGKSTLLAVLLGFVTPTTGEVRVGEEPTSVDLADVDPTVWRQRVAWLPQRPHLLAGTLADNIALGCPQATPGQVSAAAAAAGVTGPEGFADALPGRLATVVGEGGSGLSAGQRQRVALARALLRSTVGGAGLLLLDEATAGLDPGTEAAVVEAVVRHARTPDAAGRRRSVLLVAHRDALVAVADRVVPIAGVEVAA